MYAFELHHAKSVADAAALLAKTGGKVTERRDALEHKARIAFWYDPDGNLAETVQMQ